MTIYELWGSQEYEDTFNEAMRNIRKLPHVNSVDIIIEYSDVDDKRNYSASLPKLKIILWMLKLKLKQLCYRQWYRWRYL